MNTNDFYNDNTPSRVRKNANLYKRIDASKIDEVELPKKEEPQQPVMPQGGMY